MSRLVIIFKRGYNPAVQNKKFLQCYAGQYVMEINGTFEAVVITDGPGTQYKNVLRWYEMSLADILYLFQSD